eukprot:scaffold3031_cov28-Tisochrysis_lutea.AAC.11
MRAEEVARPRCEPVHTQHCGRLPRRGEQRRELCEGGPTQYVPQNNVPARVGRRQHERHRLSLSQRGATRLTA